MLAIIRKQKLSNQLVNRKHGKHFEIGESVNNFQLKKIEQIADYNLVGYEWQYTNGIQYYHLDSQS